MSKKTGPYPPPISRQTKPFQENTYIFQKHNKLRGGPCASFGKNTNNFQEHNRHLSGQHCEFPGKHNQFPKYMPKNTQFHRKTPPTFRTKLPISRTNHTPKTIPTVPQEPYLFLHKQTQPIPRKTEPVLGKTPPTYWYGWCGAGVRLARYGCWGYGGYGPGMLLGKFVTFSRKKSGPEGVPQNWKTGTVPRCTAKIVVFFWELVGFSWKLVVFFL